MPDKHEICNVNEYPVLDDPWYSVDLLLEFCRWGYSCKLQVDDKVAVIGHKRYSR